MEQMVNTSKNNVKSKLFLDFIMVLTAVLTGLAISKFIIFRTTVEGRSMEPTYHNGDVCMALTTYWVDTFNDGIQYGDVVIIKNDISEKYLIKRVIAKPGDTILITNSTVYVNDVELDELYISEGEYSSGLASESFKLGVNEYFVMGDNRPVSYDSREFGAVSKSQILGVVVGDK